MADERRIPGYDPARIEREVDDEQETAAAEFTISRPDAEGAELQSEVESHAEPPAEDRGYRNLNE